MGGGKGGGGGPQQWQIDAANQWGQAGYDWGAQGGRITDQSYDRADPFAPYWEQGYQRGYQEWQRGQLMGNLQEMMGGFEMPGMGGMSYEKQMALQAKARGESKRNAMYTEYMDSASMATDYVNAQINEEISNANLMGVEYNLTDEDKRSRIENYFASIWGEGQDAELRALVDEWGAPEGFTDWTMVRGDASLADPSQPGSEREVLTTKPPPPPPPDDEPESNYGQVLGQASILG